MNKKLNIKHDIINNCLTFLPLKRYLKVIKYSKKYQKKGNVNLCDYIIISTNNMDTYYDYYHNKYPFIKQDLLKFSFLSFLKEYSLHNVITVNSAGAFTKEILSNINNIHVYVSTNHFLKDNFSIKDNSNVVALTLNLSEISIKRKRILLIRKDDR